MKLKIENVGNISDAEIDINNLTIIAGPNNTGKSTLSKALYGAIKSLNNINERVLKDREKSINRRVNSLIKDDQVDEDVFESYDKRNVIDKFIFENLNDKNRDSFVEKLLNFIKSENIVVEEELLNKISDAISPNLNMESHLILERLSHRIFYNEFSDNFIKSSANNKNTGVISLDIQNDTIQFLMNEKEFIIKNEVSLSSIPIYIDDKNAALGNHSMVREVGHVKDLKKMYDKEIRKTATDELITDDILKEIYTKLSNILTLTVRDENSIFGSEKKYFDKNNTEIDIRNISDGLKTFILLDDLIRNGSLRNDGILIFDEPEVHLHPEWQIVLAELIILIQQKFNMHVLVITHSPYFMQAIQVFSRKHDIDKFTKFYLSSNGENTATFEDVTNNVEKIYDLLAQPFDILNDIESEIDDK